MNGVCGPLQQPLPELDPTRRKLQNLVSAIEAGMRCDMGTYLDVVGVVGRESYRFSAKEPRYTSDLLGGGTSTLASDAFYVTRPWSARTWVARNAQELQDTSASASDIPEAEKKGFAAFARTIIGYQLLLNLNLSDSNGLRVAVTDKTQPTKTKTEALEHLARLLDDAKADLASATFGFTLSSGFQDFTTPAAFTRFNRALAARIAAYRQQWEQTLTYLGESFFALDGDPSAGVYLRFTDVPGDLANPLFAPPNASGEVRLAHPSFVTDMVPGDDRSSKATARTAPASQDGLTSTHDIGRYPSAAAPLPIIRNEELVLLYAEAKIMTNSFAEAVAALDRVRTTHKLSPYDADGATQEMLMDELVRQRRFSLAFEGHRWIDARRLGRLNELPRDRPDDDVWPAFPIPLNDGLP